MAYCGPRRAATERQLAGYARRGWAWETKEDGVYVELHVGVRPGDRDAPRRLDGGYDRRCCGAVARPGVITQARFRSGEVVTLADVARGRDGHRCRDVVGLETQWAPGTVIVGELMVQTPGGFRWQDAHDGMRGVVLFDLLAEGLEDMAHDERQALAARGIVPAIPWAARPNAERRSRLERMVGELDGRGASVLHLVRRGSGGGARRAFRELGEQGAEGIVLKDPAAPAGEGLAKVKHVGTLDCRVVQVLAGEGVALVALGSRPPFRVTLPRFEIAVGQVVEIAHRGWYEGSMTPRHAVAKRVRDDLSAVGSSDRV